MNVTRPLVAGLLFIQSLSLAHALETDQYMVWNRELKDSSLEVNKYLNDKIKGVLKEVNDKHKLISCSKVHNKIIHSYLDGGVITDVENWAYGTPLIEKYPIPPEGDKNKVGAVVNQTIYRGSLVFKTKIFAINININGTYLGIDKLAHLLQTGYGYYKKYAKKIKDGATPEEATIASIQRGVFQERTYYGYAVSGVFSFADLEANYQGLLFNQKLCDGPDKLLERDDDGQWTIKKEVDIREYINPYFDESYNPNAYTKGRAKKIHPYVKEYCDVRLTPAVLARMSDYASRSTPSVSVKYLEEMVKAGKLKDPALTDIEHVCNDKE